jgi:predicted  nucleic acid-binding Zn-ribbon protein
MKLETERKNKKELASAERAMQQNQTRSEVAKLEAEIKTLRQELQMARDRCDAAEREVYILRQYKETHGDPEMLVNALKVSLQSFAKLMTRQLFHRLNYCAQNLKFLFNDCHL